MLAALEQAIDQLDLSVDKTELVAAFAARDRLDAKLCAAVNAYDQSGSWARRSHLHDRLAEELLRHERPPSPRLERHRHERLPLTAAAFADGTLSRGQIDAVCASLDATTIGLFADH